MVERLAEQDLARSLVVAAQRAGHVRDRHDADGYVECLAQAQLEMGIDLVGLGLGAVPEHLRRLLELAEMVAVAPEESMHDRLGPSGDDLLATRDPALRDREQLLGRALVGAVQPQEGRGERRAVHERRAQLREIGPLALEDRILHHRAQIGEQGRALVLGDVAPVDAIDIEQPQQHLHRHAALVVLKEVDVGGADPERLRHRALGLAAIGAQPPQPRADEGLLHGCLLLFRPQVCG
jgi:hypothetical protein